MPGTFVIDQAATFATALLMGAQPKPNFGGHTGAQETSADGTPKWLMGIAVTFTQQSENIAPVSEVLTITVTSSRNPGENVPVGSPVVLEGLRVGISPPEKRDNGTIRGGRLWYSATGARPVMQHRQAEPKAS